MIFIDTWGFIAFINKREPKHGEVVNLLNDEWNKKESIYTSDYVLDETISFISRNLDYDKVDQFLETIDKALQNDSLKIFWIKEDEFNEAIRKRKKYKDKLDISFTDLTTAVLMEKYHINKIITQDKHFQFLNNDFEFLFQ